MLMERENENGKLQLMIEKSDDECIKMEKKYENGLSIGIIE
jgi:hypothetical protein